MYKVWYNFCLGQVRLYYVVLYNFKINMFLQGYGVSIYLDYGFCIKLGIFRVGFQQYICCFGGNIIDLSQCDNRFDNFKFLFFVWQLSCFYILGFIFDVIN